MNKSIIMALWFIPYYTLLYIALINYFKMSTVCFRYQHDALSIGHEKLCSCVNTSMLDTAASRPL